MSRIKRKSCTDAFRLLMQGNPKRRARFVLCPAGCGASIAEYQINSHLDKCFASQSDLDRIGRTKEDASELAGENRQTSNIDLERYGKAKRKGNVFEHMMDQSKTHFVKARQTFHLDENAALSWMTEPRGLDSVGSNLCWSSSFDLCSKNGQKITLTLSTSYTGRRDNIAFTDANETTTLQEQEQEQEQQQPKRWVKFHSRLSVPVLKSMLQKCIRRRRPLPATKVAMELADKSLESLLRRLPIIILEDSTLHPDFSLLVWLMVANSKVRGQASRFYKNTFTQTTALKGYKIPQRLLERVFHVVFQVASCPYVDYPDKSGDEIVPSTDIFSFSNVTRNQGIEAHWRTTIFSMLLRSQYGGMRSDLQMLQAFSVTWENRCRGNSTISCSWEMGSDSGRVRDRTFSDVPVFVHSAATRQSPSRVSRLVPNGIDFLCRSDMCLEGVDFHCSPIVEHLLRDPSLSFELKRELQHRPQFTRDATARRSPVQDERLAVSEVSTTEEIIRTTIKECIWHFSSGVNYRLPLIENRRPHKPSQVLEALWKRYIKSRADRFMTLYVEQRVVCAPYVVNKS